MLAQRRLGRIVQSILLQADRLARGRQIVDAGQREITLQQDGRHFFARQRGGEGLGEQVGAARGHGNRRFRQRLVGEELFLGDARAMHQRQELPRVDFVSVRLDLALQGVGEGEVHVVPAQQDMFAHRDAVQFQALGQPVRVFRHGDETEVGGAAADVHHQDQVACGHLFGPGGNAVLVLRMGDPGVEGGLRLLQQRDVAESCIDRRLVGQGARHLVERGGDGQHDLAVGQRGAVFLPGQVTFDRLAHMGEVDARGLERRDLALFQLGIPGQDGRIAVDVRIAQPGLG